jgi:hypothetical protein
VNSKYFTVFGFSQKNGDFETVDSLSEAFTPFANLNDYHYEGEMISLVRTDGNHLIAVGGTHNSITTTSELYDESSDTWKELGDLENLPYNYRDFDTIESEGKTLMFGGFAVEPSQGGHVKKIPVKKY